MSLRSSGVTAIVSSHIPSILSVHAARPVCLFYSCVLSICSSWLVEVYLSEALTARFVGVVLFWTPRVDAVYFVACYRIFFLVQALTF